MKSVRVLGHWWQTRRRVECCSLHKIPNCAEAKRRLKRRISNNNWPPWIQSWFTVHDVIVCDFCFSSILCQATSPSRRCRSWCPSFSFGGLDQHTEWTNMESHLIARLSEFHRISKDVDYRSWPASVRRPLCALDFVDAKHHQHEGGVFSHVTSEWQDSIWQAVPNKRTVVPRVNRFYNVV